MKPPLILIPAVLAFILAAPAALAQELELELFVDATLGIRLEAEDEPIVLNLGETGGTFLTIINEANIRDKIRLNGRVRQNNVPTDWVKLAFVCGSTVGECDDIPSSETRTVDNIELTPEIASTQVFAELTGWRKFNSGDEVYLHLDGFSLTNNTVQSDLDRIKIIVKDPDAGRGPLASPGLSNPSLLMLLTGSVAFIIIRRDML